jgi:hypothetical protein
MRYIIYTYCFETPHLETDMEIALNLINAGHDVYFLTCREELKTCFINPQHSKAICAVCKSKVANGLDVLKIDSSKRLYYNKVAVDETIYKDALNSLAALKAYQYKGSDVGLAVASSIISATRDHNFDITQYLAQVRVGLETAITVHENLSKILVDIKPDGVVMFNGRFLESRPVLRLCEKLGIDFYTHERGGQIDRYMFRKNSTPHTLSYAKQEIEDVWKNGSTDKEEIGKKFFVDRRSKVVQTWHVFTEDQNEGSLPLNFDYNKRNVCIFNSSMDEYEGIADFNYNLYNDDNEAIEKICTSFLNNPDFHFYLRVHPNLKDLANSQNKSIDEIKRKYKNLTVIPAHDDIDSYALMEAAELIITFGSTMGIEALYWKKPSILLGRAFYEDLEGIITPTSHEETVEYIKNIKSVSSGISAIKYGYWCLTYGTKFEFFAADSLFYGKFLNKEIKGSLYSRIRRKLAALPK